VAHSIREDPFDASNTVQLPRFIHDLFRVALDEQRRSGAKPRTALLEGATSSGILEAMSAENVEVVRRAWNAWISGDLSALFAMFDPEVVWDTTNFVGWPEDDVYSGSEGVRRFFEAWLAGWESYEAGVDEILDVDDVRVLVLCWQRGIGPGSRVPVEMDFAQLCTLRRGRIWRMDAYSDRRSALQAAGLEE
jgi:ketosteroid isomerase-like protein